MTSEKEAQEAEAAAARNEARQEEGKADEARQLSVGETPAPKAPSVEAMARAMCRHAGHDEERLLYSGVPEEGPIVPGLGQTHFVPSSKLCMPSWHAFASLAEAALAKPWK